MRATPPPAARRQRAGVRLPRIEITFDLLDAVHDDAIRTTADVAAKLGVPEANAERQLRVAEDAELVDEHDGSQNWPRGADRQHWSLTEKGRVERLRLRDDLES